MYPESMANIKGIQIQIEMSHTSQTKLVPEKEPPTNIKYDSNFVRLHNLQLVLTVIIYGFQ